MIEKTNNLHMRKQRRHCFRYMGSIIPLKFGNLDFVLRF